MTAFSAIESTPKLDSMNSTRIFPTCFPKPFHGVMPFTGLQSPRSNRTSAVDAFVSIKVDGLCDHTSFCHALYDRTDSRSRPCPVLDAISCTVLGHCSCLWT